METKTIGNCAKEAEKRLEHMQLKSAWDRGVHEYALELLDNLSTEHGEEELPMKPERMEKLMLNGASSWEQYSHGGCSLCWNGDIARRLCTPSEFKRKKEGELDPNGCESWLDVQARALFQAARRVRCAYYEAIHQYINYERNA